jgi:acyl-CoA dehydrogenase
MMHAMNLHHLCWPFFDSEHATFADDFGRWAERELAAFEADEGGDGQAARRLFQLLAASHWLEATLPMARGDREGGLDVRKICLMREISAFSSAMADVALSEPWLGILPIALYGSPALRDELLPPYLAGRLLPAFALSEPDAGSDAAAIATTARRAGDDYILDGVKTWTSNCGLADVYVVLARMEGEGGGLSAFAVDGRSPGIALEQRVPVLSPHTVGTWRLSNCRVPSHRLIGAAGEGFAIAMRVLELFRPTVGAATLGFARRAMAEAVSRSVSRVAFKKPIAEHQLIQAKLADMAVKIDAAALLTYRAAWQADSTDGSIAREAAMAKLFSSEMAFEVIDEALQIFGGLGVVRGSTVERLFRHSRAFRIFDGTSEIQRLIIARSILQQERT